MLRYLHISDNGSQLACCRKIFIAMLTQIWRLFHSSYLSIFFFFACFYDSLGSLQKQCSLKNSVVPSGKEHQWGFFRLTETLCIADLISCPHHTLLSHRLSPLHPSSSSQEDKGLGRLQEPSRFPGAVPELLANAGKPWQITGENGADGWTTSWGLEVPGFHSLVKGFEKLLDEESSRVFESN